MAQTPSSTDGNHSQKLKLVLKTADEIPGKSNFVVPGSEAGIKVERDSSSPSRPSFSPVTPVLSHTALPGPDGGDRRWMDEPQPLPISLDENADAIALKATISLLQMQRQQSMKDIRHLDKMKDAALEDPEAFVQDLRSGKLKTPASNGLDLDDDLDDSEDEKPSGRQGSKFGKIPNSQNVARCPPVEWQKYNIIGKPLDAIHELQQRYPGVKEADLASGMQPQQHEILAPYRPFVDRLESKKENDGYET